MKIILRNNTNRTFLAMQKRNEILGFSHNGSSETTREVNFDFIDFKKKLPGQKKWTKDFELFLIWFIGFSEGDGSFITDPKNKRNFFFLIQADPKVLYLIKDKLGFGNVQFHDSKKNYYRFSISDQKEIDLLIRIFNGNLQLKKTEKRFLQWFEIYNQYTKVKDKVDFKGNNSIPGRFISLENPWLTGFIDAEGCFNAGLNKSTTISGYSMLLRFIIDQKGEKELLKQILTVLGWGVLNNRYQVTDMQRITLTSNKKETYLSLIMYLDKYKLKTNKILSYKRWKRVFHYASQEKLREIVKQPKILKKVQRLLQSINQNLKI